MVRHIWNWLVNPHTNIPDPQLRQHAALLDRILLAVVVVLGGILWYYNSRGNSFEQPDYLLSFITWLLFCGLLVGSRLSYFRFARAALVGIIGAASVFIPFVPGSQINLLYFAILPVLLTAILFRPVAVMWMTVAVTLLALGQHLLSSRVDFLISSPDAIPVIVYLIFVNVIISVYTNHNRVLESIRREQLEQANEALRLSEVSLEQRVVERTAELEEAYKRLEELSGLKDQFVANVSHELRSPIASMRVNHRLLAMNDAKRDVYMERLSREYDRLSVLIEDLLRLSGFDQGRVRLHEEPLNVNEFVRQFVEDRTALVESRGLAVGTQIAPDLPNVRADSGLLGQVLSILMTNATNYTPAGGKITISAFERPAPDGRKWICIEVSDTGPGISTDDHEHLFERFYRGKAAHNSGTPGTGLGLAIAHEIVTLHNGLIECDSNDQTSNGTTFRVLLPHS